MTDSGRDQPVLVTVPYDESFLAASGRWLRDPETAWLTMTPQFDEADQRRWYDRLATMNDYLIWGVSLRGRPVGAFGLKHVTDADAEYWGYLGDKELWGSGLGRHLVEDALERARGLGLTRVHLRVRAENERAIRLYRACGFDEVDHDQGVIVMRRTVETRP